MSWFTQKRIYLDHASAPPVDPAAAFAMKEAEKILGNPGAIHAEGVAAKYSLEKSRTHIAEILGCKAREVIFTSGLTEANNLAIVGYARGLERTLRTLAGTHWIVSSIEHASVLESFAEIERMGGIVSHVEPNERGIITPESVVRMLRRETVFVSIGWANNEIGTVSPLTDIARALRIHEKKEGTEIVFHADAGQGPLYRGTSPNSLGVDLLSLGSNKLYGPHGVGCLYVNNRLPAQAGIHLASVILGGKQERGLRAGTENVALAAGFAAAFGNSARAREREAKRLKKLRDEFAGLLLEKIPGLVVNGDLKAALPHMLNISIPNISTEYLTLALDHEGIAVSTKSACREGEESRSHVVHALGGESWRAQNTLRFSLGMHTTARDMERTAKTLERLIQSAR